MNHEKLKKAEQEFLMRYPGGFDNLAMREISKKHKSVKMAKFAQDNFALSQFEDKEKIIESFGKIVSLSSLVSVFEKIKFRDIIKILHEDEKQMLAIGLKEFLHGDASSGFSLMVQILKPYKIAKWPILTVIPYYYNPSVEILIKPTTVKGVIAYFELEGLTYSPSPTYEFYKAYRDTIDGLKKEVDPSLRAYNAGFCGFLMMSLEHMPNHPLPIEITSETDDFYNEYNQERLRKSIASIKEGKGVAHELIEVDDE